MSKEIIISFFLLFKISIYSEDRYFNDEIFKGTYYKHFITISLLGVRILYVMWHTGIDKNGNINTNDFYVSRTMVKDRQK